MHLKDHTCDNSVTNDIVRSAQHMECRTEVGRCNFTGSVNDN